MDSEWVINHWLYVGLEPWSSHQVASALTTKLLTHCYLYSYHILYMLCIVYDLEYFHNYDNSDNVQFINQLNFIHLIGGKGCLINNHFSII